MAAVIAISRDSNIGELFEKKLLAYMGKGSDSLVK